VAKGRYVTCGDCINKKQAAELAREEGEKEAARVQMEERQTKADAAYQALMDEEDKEAAEKKVKGKGARRGEPGGKGGGGCGVKSGMRRKVNKGGKEGLKEGEKLLFSNPLSLPLPAFAVPSIGSTETCTFPFPFFPQSSSSSSMPNSFILPSIPPLAPSINSSSLPPALLPPSPPSLPPSASLFIDEDRGCTKKKKKKNKRKTKIEQFGGMEGATAFQSEIGWEEAWKEGSVKVGAEGTSEGKGAAEEEEEEEEEKEKEKESDAGTVTQPESCTRPPSFPDHFICPITINLMTDPVCASDGCTYERAAISSWLETHNSSPLTGLELDSHALFPNILIRKMIREYVEANAN
jgi:hypothetical protein